MCHSSQRLRRYGHMLHPVGLFHLFLFSWYAWDSMCKGDMYQLRKNTKEKNRIDKPEHNASIIKMNTSVSLVAFIEEDPHKPERQVSFRVIKKCSLRILFEINLYRSFIWAQLIFIWWIKLTFPHFRLLAVFLRTFFKRKSYIIEPTSTGHGRPGGQTGCSLLSFPSSPLYSATGLLMRGRGVRLNLTFFKKYSMTWCRLRISEFYNWLSYGMRIDFI